MRPLPAFRWLHILALGLTLMLGVFVASSQDTNLLQNPGFEPPFRTVDGNPPREVADGWSAWHLLDDQLVSSVGSPQPEYAPASSDPTPRVRGGEEAQKIFSTFSTNVGGVFQRVSEGISPQTEYQFTVYGWVWSASGDDPAVSDSDANVTIEVGIDPTGGTDFESEDIVWSLPDEQYDAFNPYTVVATSTSNALTVFVRVSILETKFNSVVYLDDAELLSTAPVLPPDEVMVEVTEVVAEAAQAEMTEAPAAEQMPTNAAEPTATPLPTVPAEPTATATPLPTAEPTIVSELAPDTGEATAEAQAIVPISETFPGTLLHTVRRGEIVADLAVLYGSSVEAIIQANGLNENALIYVGQGLIIPVRLPPPATSTPTSTPLVIVVTATPVPVGDAPSGGANDQGEGVYVVRPGDTLSGIATRLNTTVTALAQLNGIANVNRIAVGQRLLIPGTGGPVQAQPDPAQPTATPLPSVRVHQVRPGDSLYRLALTYNVSLAQLIDVNYILNPNLIYVGQLLIIP